MPFSTLLDGDASGGGDSPCAVSSGNGLVLAAIMSDSQLGLSYSW